MDKINGHFNSPILHQTLISFFALSLIYFITLLLINKIKNRFLKILFLSIVLIGTILPIFIYPISAADLFDYIAQAKLFYFFKQNPYLADLSLYSNDIFWKYTVSPDSNLLYGPVWLLSVFIPNLLINFKSSSALLESLIIYKILNLFFLFFTGLLITKLHPKKKLFYWYFFVGNPYVIYEIIVNGHNEILIALFLVLVILFSEKRPYLTCILLTIVSLIKIYFIILVPLFLIRLIILKKYQIKEIVKLSLSSITTFFLFYLPFIFRSGINPILLNIFGSQNYYTYSVNSLLREYLNTYNYPQIYLQVSQIILFIIFFIVSILIILKTQKNNLFFPLFIIINLLIILLTFSHPWYFIGSLALLTSRKENMTINILASLITLLLLCFYPISVWLWFNSNFSTLSIHLNQSLFIILIIVLSSTYIYIYRNSIK